MTFDGSAVQSACQSVIVGMHFSYLEGIGGYKNAGIGQLGGQKGETRTLEGTSYAYALWPSLHGESIYQLSDVIATAPSFALWSEFQTLSA